MKTKSNGLYYMEIYNSLDAELQNMSGENEDEIKYNKLFYHMEIYNSLDAAWQNKSDEHEDEIKYNTWSIPYRNL